MRGLFVVLVLTGCDVDTASQFYAQRDQQATCASFGVNVLDFGNVVPFRRVEKAVRLRNPRLSNLVVRVQPLRTPFSVTRSGPLTLVPGGETLSLVFSPPDGRAYQDELVLSQDDPQCPDTSIFLTGAGLPSVIVPPTFSFGVVPIGVTSERTVSLLNAMPTAANLQFSAVGDLQIFVPAARVAPMSAYELTLRVTPRMSGPIEGTLVVNVMGAASQFMQLQGSAGLPRLELDTTTLSLPTIPLAVTGVPPLRRAIPFVNGGDGVLTLDRVEIVPENFTSNALELSVTLPEATLPGGTSKLAVSFSPTGAPGPRAWAVRLITNEPSAPERVLHFTGNVASVVPCSMPIAPTVSNSRLTPPYPQTVTLTLSNPNATECFVDDLRLLEPWWSLVPAEEQLVIPAGQSVTRVIEVDQAGTQTLGFTTWGNTGGYTFLNLNASL